MSVRLEGGASYESVISQVSLATSFEKHGMLKSQASEDRFLWLASLVAQMIFGGQRPL